MPRNKVITKKKVKDSQKIKKMEVSEIKNGQPKLNRGQQKMVGRIVSAKLPKTVTVLVETKKTHPLYGKSYKASKKYLVHADDKLSEGDIVEIGKIRPISKNKHFIVLRVVGKNIEAIVAEQLKEAAAEEIAEVMPEEAREEGQELSIKGEEEEKAAETEKKTRAKKEKK